jgi:hypothetical protein
LPDFTPTYTPITGDALTAAGLNTNTYSTVAGRSIYETTNGNLDFVNFDPAFEVQGYHVRPGQTGQATSVGRLPSNDYFSDLWSGGSVGYIPVAGCAVTFYTPYDVTMAMFFASCFVTTWRQFGPDNGVWPSRAVAPDISIRTFFADPNGGITSHVHSQRDMPQTVFLDSAAAATQGNISMVEQRTTRHFNLSHPKMAGGTSPCDQLLAGEHTFGLAVLVKQNLSGQDENNADESWDLRLNGNVSPDARPVSFYSAIQRIRFYVRGVSAIRLL